MRKEFNPNKNILGFTIKYHGGKNHEKRKDNQNQ